MPFLGLQLLLGTMKQTQGAIEMPVLIDLPHGHETS